VATSVMAAAVVSKCLVVNEAKQSEKQSMECTKDNVSESYHQIFRKSHLTRFLLMTIML